MSWKISFQRLLSSFGILFFLSTNANAQASETSWAPLTDCAAFFGLASQGNSEKTEQFKSLAFIYSSYAASA